MYSGDLFKQVTREAIKPDGIFTAEDRVGLLLDTLAFAKAGLIKTSSMLWLAKDLRKQRNCKILF
jgi:aminopeptidase 2